MTRYTFKQTDNICFCSDREAGIKCTFELHKFNDTQKFEVFDESKHDVMSLARSCREMGDWLRENHYDKIF